jgi:quinol monooxygenase YgiN
MEKGRIVIVAYKPIAGKEKQLDALMKTHVEILRKEGLATDRESMLMRCTDGSVLEVFEWKSREAIESAHNNPAVQKMWQEYGEVCTFVPLSQVKETQNMFAEFAPF